MKLPLVSLALAVALAMVLGPWSADADVRSPTKVSNKGGKARTALGRFRRSLEMSLETFGPFYKLRTTILFVDNLPECEFGASGPTNSEPMRMYLESSSLMKKVTGVQLLEVDWNACGHPPDAWLQPHTDVHWHHNEDIDPRVGLTCDNIDGVPPYICTPGNPGAAPFFDTPADFENLHETLEPDSVGVEAMGLHWVTPPTYAADAWVEPAFIQGTYAGQNLFYEYMLPHSIVATGDDYTLRPSYRNQNKPWLPFRLDFRTNGGMKAIFTNWGFRKDL